MTKEQLKDHIEKHHGNNVIGGQGRSKESLEHDAKAFGFCGALTIVGAIVGLVFWFFAN